MSKSEAHEQGVVFSYHADLSGDFSGKDLSSGYEIKALENVRKK